MRILHTADWHLGHTLRDHSREHEHRAFLDWLLGTIRERRVDALLIAGDVFETANPPVNALRTWFDFLHRLREADPGVQVVAIAGNHDSPARLEAPGELLRGLGVHLVGSVRRDLEGRLAVDDLLVPLRGRNGNVEALCVAIPFLRMADLPPLPEGERPDAGRDPTELPRPGDPPPPTPPAPPESDPVIAAVRALHDEVFAAARQRLQPGQALVAMTHAYLAATRISELSERKVLGGNLHALPADLFPPDCAYVALGHLHLPQQVGDREHVRYSGAPLPLAMPERRYPHQVCFADLRDGALEKTWRLRVPRAVDFLRVPEHGAAEPDEVLAALAELPSAAADAPAETLPYLEVAVRLPRPVPDLQQRIEQALQDKAARLVRIEREGTGHGRPLAESAATPTLDALTPEDVFRRRYERDHREPLPDGLLAAFHELVDQVGQEP